MQIRIDLSQVLYFLFCLYGFLLPFEFVLEVWFGIDTILKPYRIVNLLIIGVFGLQVLRLGLPLRTDMREDMFLYWVFAYGILVTLFQCILAPFSFSHFANHLFQSGLYLLAFFIFKSLELSHRQLLMVFKCFVLGMLLNSAYIFYNFVVLGIVTRDSGYMDNPNYVAFGLVALISFFMLKLDELKRAGAFLGYLLLILFSLYVLVITGSRTGLVLLGVSFILIFFFLSWRLKMGLILVSVILVMSLIGRDLRTVQIGGPLILVNRVINSLSSEEEDVRFVIWRGTFQALEERGYFGMGIGQFNANFSAFFNRESNKKILEVVNRGYHLSTHNDYLAILTDYGIPGLSFYLIFLFVTFKKKLLQIGNTLVDRQRLWKRLTFVIFSFIIVFGMAAENFQNQLFWFLIMFATKTPTDWNQTPEPDEKEDP